MKIFNTFNVHEAAIKRINYIFDEFPNVVVCISGGKDSSVIFDLCLKIATEKKRLPINVMWIDQEAEWEGTVECCKNIFYRDDVKPYWYQIPFIMTNNASNYNEFSSCWDNANTSSWLRDKDNISIKQNNYETNTFHELFKAIIEKDFAFKKTCYIGGIRTDEAPTRLLGLTTRQTYKWITFGKKISKIHYTFYPIYDWAYTDVWKYIYDNKVSYNIVYDKMYQLGCNVNDMRISNIHHETSVQSLKIMQEIEPYTWDKITKKITGANTINNLSNNAYKCPKKYPTMFNSWADYANHLIENLIQEEDNKKIMRECVAKNLLIYIDNKVKDYFYKQVINTILTSDWTLIKIGNWAARPDVYTYRKMRRKKTKRINLSYALNNKYISKQDKAKLIKELC